MAHRLWQSLRLKSVSSFFTPGNFPSHPISSSRSTHIPRLLSDCWPPPAVRTRPEEALRRRTRDRIRAGSPHTTPRLFVPPRTPYSPARPSDSPFIHNFQVFRGRGSSIGDAAQFVRSTLPERSRRALLVGCMSFFYVFLRIFRIEEAKFYWKRLNMRSELTLVICARISSVHFLRVVLLVLLPGLIVGHGHGNRYEFILNFFF